MAIDISGDNDHDIAMNLEDAYRVEDTEKFDDGDQPPAPMAWNDDSGEAELIDG